MSRVIGYPVTGHSFIDGNLTALFYFQVLDDAITLGIKAAIENDAFDNDFLAG